MAQTHRDGDHRPEVVDALKRLVNEAKRMTEAGENEITAGAPDEEPLATWGRFGVRVTEFRVREVDQELDVIRISVGGPIDDTAYCVLRGDPKRAVSLLRAAANAIARKPEDA